MPIYSNDDYRSQIIEIKRTLGEYLNRSMATAAQIKHDDPILSRRQFLTAHHYAARALALLYEAERSLAD